jgi:hypothetical protein
MHESIHRGNLLADTERLSQRPRRNTGILIFMPNPGTCLCRQSRMCRHGVPADTHGTHHSVRLRQMQSQTEERWCAF